MKNIRNIIKNTLLIALLAGCFTACNSDDELNSKELFVYLRNWTNETIDVQRSYTTNGDYSIKGTDSIRFMVYLSREASVDVQATLDVDSAAVSAYNLENETNYKVFPESAVINLGQEVIIPAGSMQSDSVKISFDYSKLEPGEYLLPLGITSVQSEDKGIQASSTTGTVFYKFNISIDNINNSDVSVSGTKLDRSGWKITSDDMENASTFPVTNIIDGDADTYWEGTKNTKSSIIVDMGQKQDLKGLSYRFKNAKYQGAPSNFQIYTSQDGKNWSDYGSAGTYTYGSYYNIDKEFGINFYVPISCRYFKMQVTYSMSSTSYGAKINEINAQK